MTEILKRTLQKPRGISDCELLENAANHLKEQRCGLTGKSNENLSAPSFETARTLTLRKETQRFD